MLQETFDTHSSIHDLHPGLLRFVTRYEGAQHEAARVASARYAKKRNQLADRDNEFAQRARQEREEVRERMQKGFRLKWARNIAGRVRQPFAEMGLRSEDNPILQLFVSRVPTGGRARASEDKATLYVPSRHKVLTLDNPYLEFNKTFLGMIRQDCDAVFQSPEACREALQGLVGAKAIPHLPHIATGDLMPDGTFNRPHFYFMLPPESAVWNKFDDERCRTAPVSLFGGVSRGLAKAMLPIGVDPAAPRLTMRGKNPVSPYWHTIILNTSEFMTLSQYAKVVDTRATMEELVRQAAAVQSEMGITPSNIAFSRLKERAKALLREWHFAADVRMSGSRERLADHLHEALEAHAQETGLDDVHLACIISKVATYLAAHFNPGKLQSKSKDRHRLMHVVADVKGVAARERIGAEYSAKVRSSKARDKLLAAMKKALSEGKTMSIEDLASAAKVSRAYAYKAFEECQQLCLPRVIDKKAGAATPEQDQEIAVGSSSEIGSAAVSPPVNAEVERQVAVVEPSWKSYDPDEHFEPMYNMSGDSCAAPPITPESMVSDAQPPWPA